MKCPKCRLINPETALRCDCGYDFPSGKVKQSYLPSKAVRLPRVRWAILYGAVFLTEMATSGIHDGFEEPFLTAFLPTALGTSVAIYSIATLLSLFAGREKRFGVCVYLVVALSTASNVGRFAASSAEKLTAAQAKNHIGKNATVCGVVASANYAVRSRRKPTFLNLDEPYPRHVFTAVIWEEDRSKFGQPETLKGKRVCVKGLIEEYESKPQIILRDASQLTPE